MAPNKYIVYIDQDWVNARLLSLYGRPATAREGFDFAQQIRKQVNDFINGNETAEKTALFADRFTGPDGRKHYAVEIRQLPGSLSSTKILKRVKLLRKKR